MVSLPSLVCSRSSLLSLFARARTHTHTSTCACVPRGQILKLLSGFRLARPFLGRRVPPSILPSCKIGHCPLRRVVVCIPMEQEEATYGGTRVHLGAMLRPSVQGASFWPGRDGRPAELFPVCVSIVVEF